jgi:hypothetical protein
LLVSFQKYVLKLSKLHEYPLGQTGIADQTVAFFGMPEYTTVNCGPNNAVPQCLEPTDGIANLCAV